MPPHLLGAAQFFETPQKIHVDAKIPRSGFLQKSTPDPKIPKSGFFMVFGPIPETFRPEGLEKALIDCRALLFLTPKGVSKPPPGPPPGPPKMSCFINYILKENRIEKSYFNCDNVSQYYVFIVIMVKLGEGKKLNKEINLTVPLFFKGGV